MKIELLEQDLDSSRRTYDVHMCRDFPQDELKPWEITKSLYERGIYDFLEAYSDGKLVGYAWMVTPDGQTALIDYLAVLPQYRGTGIGSEILKCLCERYRRQGKQLILESEHPDGAPDPSLAVRRLGFYARSGFLNTGLQVMLFGVRFCILAHGICANAKQEMEHIYRAMFPDGLYETAVTFLE